MEEEYGASNRDQSCEGYVGQRLWQERSMTAAATTVEGAVEIQVAVSVLSLKRRAVWSKVSPLLFVTFRQFWEGKVK